MLCSREYAERRNEVERQEGTGHTAALLSPGLQDTNPMAPEPADQTRQARRQRLQAPLPGAPTGESALFAGQAALVASQSDQRKLDVSMDGAIKGMLEGWKVVLTRSGR